MDAVRQTLIDAVAREGMSLIRLSRLLGRNDAYLQQFVRKGSPRRLPERERTVLADYLNLDEVALGGPAERGSPVRRLDVAASAGPGALSEEDRLAAIERFPTAMLRRLALDPATLTLIAARGDSMLPTIADGDDILVDTGDRRVGAKAAIFVMRIGGALVVKRLTKVGITIVVASDNPAAPPIAALPVEAADVIGRVVWLGRKVA